MQVRIACTKSQRIFAHPAAVLQVSGSAVLDAELGFPFAGCEFVAVAIRGVAFIENAAKSRVINVVERVP